MSIERIIGIDFGTSTSVIRVKRYKDGEPLVDKLHTQAVTFNMGSTMLPTLIRKIENGTYYGYEAQIPKKNSTLYQNFKIKLESNDIEEKEQARELTKEFFKYMASVYKEQSAGGHLGEDSDAEKTLISYPVKWTEGTKEFMLQTAKEAGFPNVEGVDEAQAAIHAAIVQNEATLLKNGYLQNGKPVNIMLVDMGAGTTDIVISEYTPGEKAINKVLCTWPKDGDILFGGREVDELLLNYIRERLPENEAERVLKICSTDAFKEWKDRTVSPGLKRNKTITDFSALDNITQMLNIDVEYSFDRSGFEKTTEAYLQKLPLLIKGSLTEAGLKGSDIDLVILTGGHSQWYFVKDILTGVATKFGLCGLDKIKADHNRVISISLPQETVALGLAYDKIAGTFIRVEPPVIEDNKSDTKAGGQDDNSSLSLEEDDRIIAVAVGCDHTVGLRNNGTVVSVGNNDEGQCNVSSWNNIVQICASYKETLGVRKDGTVVSTEDNNQKSYSSWRNIYKVANAGNYIIGLRKDGTVVAHGYNAKGQCNVSTWYDIIEISVGDDHTVGLRKDGTVVAVGNNDNGQCNVSSWRNIVQVVADNYATIGLKKDGTVVATGSYYDEEIFSWTDIVAISVGYSNTVGVKRDGTVVDTNDAYNIGYGASSWNDIVQISAGMEHAVGLTGNGSVVATGNNDYGQCDVSSWNRPLTQKRR